MTDVIFQWLKEETAQYVTSRAGLSVLLLHDQLFTAASARTRSSSGFFTRAHKSPSVIQRLIEYVPYIGY